MQQQRAPRNVPDYLIAEEDDKPHQEPLPRAVLRQPEPDRFEEVETEWFWPVIFWGVGVVLMLMGACALRDMFMSNYNWLLALSWTSTACSGIGGLALIQKYWLRR